MWTLLSQRSASAERVRRLNNDPPPVIGGQVKPSPKSLKSLIATRIFEPVGKKLASPRDQTKLRKDLQMAGYHSPKAITMFMGSKVSLAVGLPLAFWLYRSLLGLPVNVSIIVAMLVGVLGLRLPSFWLQRSIKKRQNKLRSDLPDCLDLLVVSVEAGLGLDSALLKISEKLGRRCTEMASELHMVHLEVQAGRPRHKALKALGERTGVKELQSLVAKLIQAEKFGTSIARSLRVHADSIREKRRQLAEEKAGKTVVKMMIPLVFFIFPALFVVILGPAAMRVAKAMADGIL